MASFSDMTFSDKMALICLKARIEDFCKIFDSRVLMQSHTDPVIFLRSEVVQCEIGSYLVARALSEDPESFTTACNGGAIERLFIGQNAIKIDGSDERFTTLAGAKGIADEIIDERSSTAGGNSSRKTKKKGRKGRKGRKQRGGALSTQLIEKVICYALTAAVFYGVLQILGVGAAALGLPPSLTGVSGAFADILIQGNLIKNACGGSASVAMNYIGSFAGITQTCETIALENEVQLSNLTAYVATIVGLTAGSAATITFNSVYKVVCEIVRGITQVCGTSAEYASQSFAQLLTGKINELALVQLGNMVTDYPDLNNEMVEGGNAEEIAPGIIKSLVDNIRADPSTAMFESGDMVSLITNLQDLLVKQAFTQSALHALRKVDASDKKAVERALFSDKSRFMRFYSDCIKYHNCEKPKDVDSKEAAEEVRQRSPTRQERSRQLLATEDPADERQAEQLAARREAEQREAAQREEQARQEAARVEAEQALAAQQQALAAQQQAAPAQQTLGRRRRDDEGNAPEPKRAAKSTEGNEEGNASGGRRRRRRRTSKAKKHHKKGKKAHKSRKGKKANRKTKKHHKKAKKAHRKSRKH